MNSDIIFESDMARVVPEKIVKGRELRTTWLTTDRNGPSVNSFIKKTVMVLLVTVLLVVHGYLQGFVFHVLSPKVSRLSKNTKGQSFLGMILYFKVN